MTDEAPEQVEDPGAAELAAKAKAVFDQNSKNLEEFLKTQADREEKQTRVTLPPRSQPPATAPLPPAPAAPEGNAKAPPKKRKR